MASEKRGDGGRRGRAKGVVHQRYPDAVMNDTNRRRMFCEETILQIWRKGDEAPDQESKFC